MTALAAPGLPSWRRAEWAAPCLAALLSAAILDALPGSAVASSIAGSAIAALAAWIVWQDLRSFTISDAAVVALVVIAFAVRWSAALGDGDLPAHALSTMSLDVALCGGFMLAFREGYYRWKGVDGLGLGDVKLAAAGALLVGGIGFSWALVAASAAGLSVALAGSRTRAPGSRLAFGALLAPALLAVWLIEQASPRLFAG